jgi:hypothetical protein
MWEPIHNRKLESGDIVKFCDETLMVLGHRDGYGRHTVLMQNGLIMDFTIFTSDRIMK